jgi:S1-C subfamily serine protease
VPQLIRHGKVVRPGLGVHIAPERVARQIGVNGVLIVEVPQGSNADKAGLRGIKMDDADEQRLGDIIIAIDGQKVRSFDDLASALESHRVGDRVTVRVLREGEEKEFQVTLQALQ